MGRGRAKAKQTKVARDLKYRTLDTDFTELQRELHGDEPSGSRTSSSADEADTGDPYTEYSDSGDRGSSAR